MEKNYGYIKSKNDFDRSEYQRMLMDINQGDVVVIENIACLGRNYDEILEQWRFITKEKQANIKVLDMPLLDTSQGSDFMGILIVDLVLQLLSYVAQTERNFIRQRQAEGIASAKARGVKFGRPKQEKSEKFYELQKKWIAGEISATSAAKEMGIACQTFQRWAGESGE